MRLRGLDKQRLVGFSLCVSPPCAACYAKTLDVQKAYPLVECLSKRIGSYAILLTDLTLPLVS